jgi:hypothetical protein
MMVFGFVAQSVMMTILKPMTKIRTIELEYDLIEVHYNKNLKKKPYLVRVYNYNEPDPNELRLEEEDLKNLYAILKENKFL